MMLCTGVTACIYNSSVHIRPDTGGKDFKCFHHKEILEDKNVDPDLYTMHTQVKTSKYTS